MKEMHGFLLVLQHDEKFYALRSCTNLYKPFNRCTFHTIFAFFSQKTQKIRDLHRYSALGVKLSARRQKRRGVGVRVVVDSQFFIL